MYKCDNLNNKQPNVLIILLMYLLIYSYLIHKHYIIFNIYIQRDCSETLTGAISFLTLKPPTSSVNAMKTHLFPRGEP